MCEISNQITINCSISTYKFDIRMPKKTKMINKTECAVTALQKRWEGVAYMREYKRPYKQVVCYHHTHTVPNLSKHHRIYYMKPCWLFPLGGCECPCVPKCFESYYKLCAHGDDNWTTDDEEGTTWAFDNDNNVKCIRGWSIACAESILGSF